VELPGIELYLILSIVSVGYW